MTPVALAKKPGFGPLVLDSTLDEAQLLKPDPRDASVVVVVLLSKSAIESNFPIRTDLDDPRPSLKLRSSTASVSPHFISSDNS